MIPLVTFSRREKWARFIVDEMFERYPLAAKRLADQLNARGSSILAYVRAQRARMQAAERQS